jgi:hypothetical protein
MTPTRYPALSRLALVIGIALGGHAVSATTPPPPAAPAQADSA